MVYSGLIEPLLGGDNKRVCEMLFLGRLVVHIFLVFWIRLQQLPFLGVLFLLFYQRLKHGPSGGQDRIGYFQEMVSPVAVRSLASSCSPTDISHVVRRSAQLHRHFPEGP